MGMYYEGRALTPADLAALRRDPEATTRLLDEETVDPSRTLDLHKHWDALRWLLTRVSPPGVDLGSVIIGGTELGPDFSYGPARLLEPDEVRHLETMLRAVPTATLQAAFDVRALDADSVYPRIWDEDPGELWDETARYLEALREFLATAAGAGAAVLHTIC